ncbi:MAG: phosphoribosyl-ATP diphosphatase [Woeseiaceae bacterium]|jgi:phosphoribosyl-ATP pyrophosphohydrolase/phosphoribosyl-AMP cyclohydrolase
MAKENFLDTLEQTITDRLANPQAESYTSSLAAMGVKRVAQKVGEEAVELALASVDGERDELLDEAADLVFHVLVLLHVRDASWRDVLATLKSRHSG